ncbi:MAG: aminoglycoside phosphotransferase family protein, partial [Hyphomicrobiales bacterium]|nr:aminoglycoside phosphotransferase family protein [Hyphomicrobiales bacterium]
MIDQPAAIDRILEALSTALAVRPGFGAGTADVISLLPDTGLAHWHARIGDSGRLARIPKQSQMQLGAAKNLAYQVASFQAGEPSGHTPKFFGAVDPGDGLPMGALIVEAIEGRAPKLPNELAAIAETLAALHRCPMTGPAESLKRAANPLTSMLLEVRDQAEYVEAADLDEAAEAAINAELQTVYRAVERAGRAPRALISFDAHPGNFLVEESGRAVLVDLDKTRLSSPGFDLAHATLYTSTTWDVNVQAILTKAETAGFYRAWIDAMSEAA